MNRKQKEQKSLKKISEDILQGKRLRGGKDHWAKDVFEQWKSKEENN